MSNVGTPELSPPGSPTPLNCSASASPTSEFLGEESEGVPNAFLPDMVGSGAAATGTAAAALIGVDV
jgi:hypothetical protein